jgi:[FeFe] hydrogenase (group B1/B3)
MRVFDTKVQHLKYKVLREVAKAAWNDNLTEMITEIPKIIVPGPKPTMRCCIYKERAIVNERVKLAMGGDKNNPNVIEVLSIACDECSASGYEVSSDCRGCLAHRCQDVCPKGAITIGEGYVAKIDKTKCINCGMCAKVCPYSAILDHKRPCEKACKVQAISMDENKAARINNDKCVSCGACVYMCPFGAINDKSFILEAIKLIKGSDEGRNYKVYAVIAPSISSQFRYAKLGQVITGMKKLGFQDVVEAALGADMVADKESRELAEKGFVTSSCCPAFVDFIKKNYPELVDKISTNLSPAGMISQYIKQSDPTSKVIFVGPCTAKKMEFQQEKVRPYIDTVLTFEELQALFDSKDLEIAELPEDLLDNASFYGRIFARSGGVSEAVKEALKEQGSTFEVKAKPCSGLEECKLALLQASKGHLDANFIEGMACVGGCINGAGCVTHEARNKFEVDNYAKSAYEKKIEDAIKVLKV